MASLKKNHNFVCALIVATFALTAGAAGNSPQPTPASDKVTTAAPAPVAAPQPAVLAEEKAPEMAKETPPATPILKLDSEEQKRAYASGVGLAHYIEDQIAEQKELHITLDKDILISGMMDAFNHQEKMSNSDVQLTLTVFDEQIKVLKAAENQKRLEKNEAFVANFAQQDGVKKSQKGFYYLVETNGEGGVISDNSTVTVHYKGTLIDGSVINEPSVQNASQIFQVKEMMPAMRDTIKLLHKGGKLQVVIPPALVENTVKLSPPVPVNSALIYTLEVNDIN